MRDGGLAAFAFLLVAGLLAALLAVGGIGAPADAVEPGRPNILFIVTDDQRIDTLDVMPKTRRIFEEQGIEFPNAYATTPLCCPARASIFTGRYAHNHGVKANGLARHLDHDLTLQRRLQEHGYRTGVFGKYLNGWDLTENPPYFDHWSVFNNDSYTGFEANDQGRVRTVDTYATTYIATEAVRFIREAEGDDQRPWFLYLAPTAPHLPYEPEWKYADAPVPEFVPSPAWFEEDRSDKPGYVRGAHKADPARNLEVRAAQLRMLKSVDDLVQRVFSHLVARGESDNTLAVFLSDNGFMWGEHWVTQKGKPYTHSVRIPLYIRWPNRVEAGAEDPRIAANIDLAATAMKAADVRPDWPMDGRSLLSGPVRKRILLERLRRPVTTKLQNWASIRTSSFQYTEYYDGDDYTPGAEPVFREYYNLLHDPFQLRNNLGDGDAGNDPSPQTLAALHTRLAEDLTCAGQGGVPGRPRCP